MIKLLKPTFINALLMSFVVFYFNLANIQAADKGFCRGYVAAFIKKPTNVNCLINKEPTWHDNFDVHMKECLNMTESAANKRRIRHVRNVHICDNKYKFIILDDNYRIVDRAIDNEEQLKMKHATSEIKQFVLNSKESSPYKNIYRDVLKSIKNTKKQCNFRSLSVDLDNQSSTKEWVVVSEKNCLPKRKHSHIWIVQKSGLDYKILFEDESSFLKIELSTVNNFKTIQTDTEFLPEETTIRRCGGLRTTWYFERSRYIPLKASANEGGECLPHYSAQSDQVDIADYPDLLDQEMKERKKLHEPYIKAIKDYIPHWKKRRKSLTRIGEAISNNGSFNKSEEDAIKKLLNFQLEQF